MIKISSIARYTEEKHNLGMQAQRFFVASEALWNAILSQRECADCEYVHSTLYPPLLANMAFSAELFVKSLLTGANIEFSKKHNLKYLVELLPPEEMNSVLRDKAVLSNARIQCVKVPFVLDANGNKIGKLLKQDEEKTNDEIVELIGSYGDLFQEIRYLVKCKKRECNCGNHEEYDLGFLWAFLKSLKRENESKKLSQEVSLNICEDNTGEREIEK